MIKTLKYIYIFLYNSSKNKYNFISFFPLFSIAVGSIIVFFTISIMDGMEDAIMRKVESFNFTYSGGLDAESFIDSGFDIYKGNSKKYLIFKNDIYKIIKITSINNFDHFKNKYIKKYLLEDSNQSGIFIGKGLALELGLEIGDKVSLASPIDVNIATGLMPEDPLVYISGIFDYNIMDYDYNYAFISNELYLNILPINHDKIFLKSKMGKLLSKKEALKYGFVSFKEENDVFFKAIKTEKLIYSIFGYTVILIASLSSISLMSLFIVRRRKQILILKVLGLKERIISKILIVNSLVLSLIGVSIGSLIYLIIILFNFKYNFIQNIFFSNIPFDFSIQFSVVYFIQMLLISSILMLLGMIYPIKKIVKINYINFLKG